MTATNSPGAIAQVDAAQRAHLAFALAIDLGDLRQLDHAARQASACRSFLRRFFVDDDLACRARACARTPACIFFRSSAICAIACRRRRHLPDRSRTTCVMRPSVAPARNITSCRLAVFDHPSARQAPRTALLPAAEEASRHRRHHGRQRTARSLRGRRARYVRTLRGEAQRGVRHQHCALNVRGHDLGRRRHARPQQQLRVVHFQHGFVSHDAGRGRAAAAAALARRAARALLRVVRGEVDLRDLRVELPVRECIDA